jgi:hypothetical protein
MFVILRSPTKWGRQGNRTTDGLRRWLQDLYLDKPSEIERYDGASKKIVNAALDGTESRDLIKQEARELSK